MRNALVVLLATTWCSIASAATGSISLVDGSGLKYYINTNITFSTSSSASAADSEASFTGPHAATTVGGGYAASTLNDMFDGYNSMCISTTPGFCETGNANFEMYNKTGASPTFELNGRQLVFPAKTFTNGVIASRKVYVPENDAYQRWLNIFTNPTFETVTFQVNMANNLGSDNNTLIVDSSNGPASSITATNTLWVTTMQNYTPTSSTDPRIAHILQGAGAPVQASLVNFAEHDDNPYWSFQLTLLPGHTAIIMSLVSGQNSNADAIAKAKELAQAPGTTLQGLTATERNLIVNFNIGCGAIHDQCNDVIVDAQGSCTLIPLTDTPCTDDNVCTTIDRCVAGECVGSAPVTCAVTNSTCQTASCDPHAGCQTTNKDSTTTCNDNSPCTDSDACDGAGNCVGVANATTDPCDDGNACTTGDACNGAGACTPGTANTGAPCDDKNACTSNDACNASAACVGTANVGQACDDKNDCTDSDACDGSGNCAGTVNTKTTCGDGTCNPGICVSGTCFTSPWNANGRRCDVGDSCESNDVCFNGTCVAQPRDCQVSPKQCSVGSCQEGNGCVTTPRTSGTCDDGDPCTVDDTCGSGGCTGVVMDCSSVASTCFVGACNGGQCIAIAADTGTPCDDGNPATKGDACQSGGFCVGSSTGSSDSGCANAGSSSVAAAAVVLLMLLVRRRRR